MSDAFPKTGDLFEGRYRVTTMIGSGGFARVYHARDEELGREVALKILIPAKDADTPTEQYSQNLVDRFNQEARLVSRLRDNHTITMFDYGRSPEGLLYMVFEFIDGVSLGQLIQSEGALAPRRVAKILIQTLSSLEEAHAMGVLHRDLKPGNIMVFEHVGRTDQAKLLDFGIAKLTSSTQTMKGDLTADGALIGTPRYMSPEQIRGQEMTAQSDIYSLGLVAYEMIVGRKAIESNSSVTIIGAQLAPEPFHLPQRSNIPEGLRGIVNRMLAKNVSVRYKDAREVLDALERWERSPDQDEMLFAVEEDDAETAVLSEASEQWGPIIPDISDELLPLVEETPDSRSLSQEIAASDLVYNFSNSRVRQVAQPRALQEAYPAKTLTPSRQEHLSYPGTLPAAPQYPSYPPGASTRHPSYPPGALAPYPSDPSVYIAPQGTSKTVMALFGVVIVLLCTIVGFVVYNATKTDVPAAAGPTVDPRAPEVAEAEPPKQAVAAEPVKRMTIRSRPSGVRLAVNGRPMGVTPVTVTEDQFSFPMRVRAFWDGGSEIVVVKSFRTDLVLEAKKFKDALTAESGLHAEVKSKTEPAAAKTKTEPAAAKSKTEPVAAKTKTPKVKKKPTKTMKKRPNTRSKTPPKVEQPKTQESDKTEKRGGLKLPSMDDSY